MAPDLFMICPDALHALGLHWGHVTASREFVDKSLLQWKRAMEGSNQEVQKLGYAMGLPSYCFYFAYLPGLLTDAQGDAISGLFAQLGMNWSMENKIADFASTVTRGPGDRSLDTHAFSAEAFSWMHQCGFALLARQSDVTKDDVRKFIASVTVSRVIEAVRTLTYGSMMHSCFGPVFNVFLFLSLLCERYELWQDTLVYCNAALEPDLTLAGCKTPILRTLALTLQGRAFVALGRQNLEVAAQKLEAAAKLACDTEMWMCEAIALRDLKLLVLDKIGHADHASRRLGAALRKLTGPAEMLTPLLGLDCTKLMSMPAPEAEFEVAYAMAAEDESTKQLRQELSTLKLTALQKRAAVDLRDPARLDAAMDSDEPKTELIELLVQHHLDVQAGREVSTVALRQELEGMKLVALHARASVAEGVDDRMLSVAEESADPKGALIALLLCAAALAEESTRIGALRTQLLEMRLMQLHERAAEVIDAGQVEDAMESGTPKVQACIHCIHCTFLRDDH